MRDDTRLGRWLSIDPKAASFPGVSPYVSMGNNPIMMVDMMGDSVQVHGQDSEAIKVAMNDVRLFVPEHLRSYIQFDPNNNLKHEPMVEAMEEYDIDPKGNSNFATLARIAENDYMVKIYNTETAWWNDKDGKSNVFVFYDPDKNIATQIYTALTITPQGPDANSYNQYSKRGEIWIFVNSNLDNKDFFSLTGEERQTAIIDELTHVRLYLMLMDQGLLHLQSSDHSHKNQTGLPSQYEYWYELYKNGVKDREKK